MGTRKDNIKGLFSNTRSRIIIIFTFIILLIAIVYGVFTVRKSFSPDVGAGGSALKTAPSGIQSIPGNLNPTAQYTKLQTKQNVDQYKTALKKGTSSIPTLIKAQKFGDGVELVGKKASSGVGFSALKTEQKIGGARSLWLQTLQQSSCSVAAIKSISAQGASLVDLKRACSCAQIKRGGYRIAGLKSICSCKELKALGTSALEMKSNGYDALELKQCGYNACELKAANFSSRQLSEAGLSDGELKGAGFTDDEIKRAGGLPDGITAKDIRDAGCSVAALKKLLKQGVSATAIRRISGCSVAAMKSAGFSAKALRQAGFSPAALKAAGFSAAELKDAGFSAAELRNAGFSAKELKDAGFSARALRQAGFNARELKAAGFSAEALHAAGFSAQQLSDAGFSTEQLKQAGLSADEINAIKSNKNLSTLDAIKKSGCSVKAIKAAKEKGLTAKQIRRYAGCDIAALRAAGYSAKSLKAAGFSAAQLKDAGFSASELRAAGFNAKDLRDAGFSAKELKEAGYSARALKAAGFSARELKSAGFSAKDLKSAGFSAKALKDAGFSAKALKDAGFSAKALKDAGFSAKALKDAGFDEKEMQQAGYVISKPKNDKLAVNAKNQLANYQSQLLGLNGVNLPVQENNVQTGNALSFNDGSPFMSDKKKAFDKNAAAISKIEAVHKIKLKGQKQQQAIQKASVAMNGAAGQAIAAWKQAPTQVFIAGTPLLEKDENKVGAGNDAQGQQGALNSNAKPALVKAGDIMFAVLDTSINSDEPGPVLATMVSGKFKGAKLIGSFNLAPEGQKMSITFNRLSMKSAPATIPITAFAIDPNTARTALSSRTDNHYLLRYGSLFASSFLEGFGQAFSSAGTKITIGGTATSSVSVEEGVGRSVLENAVIGLTNVGKEWGQQTKKLFNRKPTVQVYSGTGLGILFTNDVKSL